MRPSTDIEVTTAVLHKVRQADHEWSMGCCGAEPLDRLEAEDLVSALGEFGWHLSADVGMPTEAPKGDPETAAAKITDCNDRQWATWYVLDSRGNMTPEEIHDAMTGGRWPVKLPPQSEASVRSRLVELERAGHVRRTANKRRTRNGGLAKVWEARTSSTLERVA